MEKFDYKGKIQVYGAMFDGVNDIILHALKGISKDVLFKTMAALVMFSYLAT